MADMKKRNGCRLTEEEIDRRVEAQADDGSAWTAPVRVRRARTLRVSLSGPLAERIGFLAKLHKAKNPAVWVQSVIEDRLQFEESALGDLKQALKISS
jgi:hypothetical protein